ncbi:MAG TPA: hypothetical protein VJ044_17640 [Candidatus Hodarchaeales archaeon]|nr:hypothetical protein [Candidatus Hodarchaeales archaeon]
MAGENGWGVEDSLGKAIIIESTKRMTQALELLRRIKMWSWEDAYDFVTVGVWNEREQSAFFEMFQKARLLGAPSPSQGIKDLDVILRTAVATSFHAVDHAGGITGLGSMVFVPDQGHRTWRLYNPSILTANYQSEGNFGRISGVPGSGKTNTACVISEQWASEPNHVAIGNIRMLKPDERFIYTHDAKAFFLAIANLPYEVKWLFTLDEGGLVYSKPDQATRRVKDLDKFARCVRKLGGSLNLVEQREDSIPNLIMEFAKNIFYCQRKGTVAIELRGPDLAFRDTVKDFTKTTLPFDTNDIAMFPINVDVQRLFSAISGSEDPKKALRQYFEMEDAPVKEYLERVCAFPPCGKSLVGMHPKARYCSNNKPPYHAQEDFNRKKKTESADIDVSLNEFLKE